MKSFLLMFIMCGLLAGCTMRYPQASPSINAYKDKFADKLEPGSTLLESTFLSTFEKTVDGKFIYKEFFPETKQIIKYKTFLDKDRNTAEGPYKTWMDDGTPSSEGQFLNNKEHGEWTTWGNGSGKTIGQYNHGKAEGVWISYDSRGNKTSETTYVNGKANGISKDWNDKGELVREITYSNGEMVSKKVHIEEAHDPDREYKVVEVKPLFPGCSTSPTEDKNRCAETEMLKFIYTNIKYPPVARENGVQGTAYVKFVIEKDGSISNIHAVRGICMDIKNECERIVRMMPKWEPGMQNGKPVRVQFYLPIKFKLE